MSASLMEWVVDQRGLTAAQFRVLMVLAKRANGDRTCFPSMQRLAEDCELTKQTVVAAVLFLRDVQKLIKIVTDREERAAILAKARARLSAQVHVYHVGPSEEDETTTPSHGQTGQIDIPVKISTGQNNRPVPTQSYPQASQTGQNNIPDGGTTGQKYHSRPVKKIIKTGQANGPESSKESRNETKTREAENLTGGSEPPLACREAGRDNSDAEPVISAAQRFEAHTRLAKLSRTLDHREYAPGRAPSLTPQEQIAAAQPAAPLPEIRPELLPGILAARRDLAQRAAQHQGVAA